MPQAIRGGVAKNFTTKFNADHKKECINGNAPTDDDGIRSTKAIHDVKVTLSQSSSDDASMIATPNIRTNNDAMELVDKLISRTSEMMDPHASNVVAFSGGVDSSLVAALAYRSFSDYDTTLHGTEFTTNVNKNNGRGSVQAVLGISPAVPLTQITMARVVAETIGITLTEVPTAEGSDETYQRNDGYACFVCKTHLYSTLETVAETVMKQQKLLNGKGEQAHPVILYNGTNADDTQDPTRLGLIAASNFQVHSPLDQINKDQVRLAAKYLGLPNWNAAASPCLRSRLAMGVMATEGHLKAVELAEEFVRRILELDETVNARVRMLSGGKAMVELDNSVLQDGKGKKASSLLREKGFEQKCIDEWGFNSFGGVRGFKTGSVAAMPTEDTQQLSSVAL